MRKTRTICTGLVSVGVLMLLAGCESGFAQGPISVRLAGADLHIASCSDLEVNTAKASVRHPTLFRSWEVFWNAKGSAQLNKGGVFSLEAGLSGLDSETLNIPIFTSGDEIEISLRTSQAPDSNASAVFVVPDGGIPEDMWLLSDGSTADYPCEGWE